MSEFKSDIAALFADTQTPQATAEEPTGAQQPTQNVPNTEGVAVQEQQTAPTEALYAGISESALLTALKERTGGKIQDFSMLEQLDELPTLRQRATELEDKAKLSPFANPIVEKLNELYNANVDNNTVQMFLEAQTLNIDGLSDKEKYVEYVVRSLPNLTKATAAEYYDEKFGEEEDMTSTQKIEKARELMQATAFLKEQKLAAENPEAIRKQTEQREIYERNRAQWQQQVRNVSNQVKSIGAAYKEADNEFSFGVTVAPQEIEALLPHVLKAVEQMPLNQDTAEMAKSILEGYWLMANKDKALQTVHRDGYAKGYELGIKAAAGSAPTIRNEAAPNAVLSDVEKLLNANPRLAKLMS